jgi:HlyD family secretion protein
MSSSERNETTDLIQSLSLEAPRQKSRYLKHLLLWFLLLAVAAFLGYRWFAADNGDGIQYRTMEATRGDLTVTVTATGNLEPTNQVDVGTEVSGTIETVEADYNDTVRQGQVLARLDTTLLEAQVNQSRAAVESARANLLQARANVEEAASELERFARVRELSGGKIPSLQDFEAAEAALKRAAAAEAMAEASIAQAEAKLRIDTTNLEKATIHSPINGVVLARSVEPGQTVAASLQAPVLFTLAEDLTQMELHVDVDEADVGKVTEGQEASFTVDAYPERTFPAHITQVRYGSRITEGVVTYPTVLTVDNTDLSLRPGMTATADIIVRQVSDTLLIPNAALRYAPPPKKDEEVGTMGGSLLSKLFPRPGRSRKQRSTETGPGGEQRVWTLRDGGPAPVSITTGVTDGIMTEVLSGSVTPGMELIIESVGGKR